jgi:hypothetical protein
MDKQTQRPQDGQDLLRLIGTLRRIEAAGDPAKIPACRDLLAKLTPLLDQPYMYPKRVPNKPSHRPPS